MAFSPNSINIIGGGSSFNYLSYFGSLSPSLSQPAPSYSVVTNITTYQSTTGQTSAQAEQATYGKIIPLWVGGAPRMGSHIIHGPEYSDDGSFRVSFGVSFGFPANPGGTRELWELRLDGFKVWDKDDGWLSEEFTFRFYPGSETQEPDPIVVGKYGNESPAYRGQALIFIEDLDLTRFDNKAPFVTARIADSTYGDPADGLTMGEAIEALAYSPYVGLAASDFDAVNLNARIDAVIDAKGQSFLDLLQSFTRIYPWDMRQLDKFYLEERTNFEPDLVLDHTELARDDDGNFAAHTLSDQESVARELELEYIDVDRDYEYNPVLARRPKEPIAVTASLGKDSITLPIVMTANDAIAAVTLRKYQDELSRESVRAVALPVAAGMEIGDIVRISTDVYGTIVGRVAEVLVGANFSTEFTLEQVMRCLFDADDPAAPATSLLVALGSGGIGEESYSILSVDGITWDGEYALGQTTFNLFQSMCYAPDLALFCATSNAASANKSVAVSSDGQSWTYVATPSSLSLTGVCWSPALGLFCAVTKNPSTVLSDVVLTSPDGLVWTERTCPLAPWWAVCWSPDLNLFCAVTDANGVNIKIMTSPDGVNWTLRLTQSTTVNAAASVCWAPALGKFIVIAQGSNNTNGFTLLSDDGVSWTGPNTTIAYTPVGDDPGWGYAIEWSEALGLAVAVASLANTATAIITSPDGVTWTERSTPLGQWNDVVWDATIATLIAVGAANAGADVMTSPDGITWTARTTPLLPDTFGYVAVAAAG